MPCDDVDVPLGKILIHTEMDDGVELPGPIVAMHGVDTPGRHVVEVVRFGGPRDGERKGWAVLDLGEEGSWEKGGYAFTIFMTLKEAQAAESEEL